MKATTLYVLELFADCKVSACQGLSKNRKTATPLFSIQYAVTCTSADVSDMLKLNIEWSSAFHTLVLNADQLGNDNPDVVVLCVSQVLLYFIHCWLYYMIRAEQIFC